jgi:di/tricarboxylate transporter
MNADQIWTLVILIAVLVLLVTEWVPAGITGLIAIVSLALTGVLPTAEAFRGLTNSAVLTVGCMFVISAGIAQTGAAAAAANRITATGLKPYQTYIALLLLTMVLSGFVNNTPLVLIVMPLILGLSNRMGEPPSRLLIPLSYLSILGGMCTLIGTSTNLITASSLLEVSGGKMAIGMFEFAKLGGILAVVGAGVFLLLRRRLLPERASLGLLTRRGVALEYMTELHVRSDSPLVECTLKEIQEKQLLGDDLRVLEVVRGEVISTPRPGLTLRAGDLLLLKGGPEAVAQLRLKQEQGSLRESGVRRVALTLFEAVITPGSPWVGRKVGALGFRERFGVSIFALQRDGAHLRDKIEHQYLHVGDVLLVQGNEASIHRMRGARGLLVVEGVDTIVKQTDRAPLAAGALLLFLVLAVSGVVAVEVGALLAALLMVLTRCLSPQRAYESVGWDVLFLVAGTIALGLAFERTDLAEITARSVVDFARPFGIRAVLGCLMVLAMLMTQILSNNATAAFMTPLAWQTGNLVDGASPLAFVMAIAFGANCSFLTPISYNTNLLVYGPGGYQFKDYFRAGLPLTVVFLVVAITVLPWIY